VVQGMMGSYLEQSKTGLNQFSALQEQMQKQTEQMLSVFGLNPKAPKA
jgi:polyhydroxyalkanoate synthesis regulator protein